MTKVFIGGSRKITRLNPAIKMRADSIMQNNYLVLIGDASGADKSMQAYFSEKGYKNVLVFCAGETCRNNVGNWEARHVQVEGGKKDFSFFASKDIEMAKEADYGFMIWDAKSKGTLHNIFTLLRNQKKVLVYFSPERKFLTIKSSGDLVALIPKCDPKAVALVESELKASGNYIEKQHALNLG